MSRQILFRGKRKDNGKWVYGYYGEFHNRPTIDEPNSCQIFEPREDAYLAGSYIGGLWHEIDPSTVGQYTGLTDKNGKRIFEGDIVKVKYTFSGENCEEIKPVTCDPKNGGYVPFTWEYQCDGCDCEVTIIETEVIGNIHDNKEFNAQNGEEKEE